MISQSMVSIKTFLLWAAKFHSLQFVFTKRLCNNAAHLLAKHGVHVRCFFSETCNPPRWLSEQLYEDFSYSLI